MTVLPKITPASPESKDALKRLVLLASLSAVLIFLPFILLDGGRFTLIADFNQQQLPFNQHSAWTIRNSAVGWDWYTDLGVNFIGAFSFYTLGSPFFWISTLFPESAFPFLIGWLYVLKYVAAAVCSFLWLRDHVRDPDYAMAGALLYAFSGFSQINLMFYHFHEVIAFFPLMLYALDHLIQEKRRGLFALTVAVNALINYFFFFGQVLFLLLYFLIFYRYRDKAQRLRAFFTILREGILGVLAAAILLLPSGLFIINSPKAGQLLYYKNFLLHDLTRYLAILKALVFPAEAMIIQSSVLPFDFSSSSLYLPVLGISMVLAAWAAHAVNRRFILAIAVLALIPALNSAFSLLNFYYYARWFYMPLLVFTALSMQSLEQAPRELRLKSVRHSLFLTAAFLLLTALLAAGYRPLIPRVDLFIGSALIAVLGLAGTLWIFHQRDQHRLEDLLRLIVIGAVITGIYSISIIRSFHPEETWRFAKGYFENTATLALAPAEGENRQNFRFHGYDPGSNLSMLNHIPSVNSFITTNSPSVHEFFNAVGIEHIAASRFPADIHDILTLLSVRYRVDKSPIAGYAPLYQKNNGAFDLYVSENPDFIPMGFPLDHWITREELLRHPEAERARILLDALVVETAQAAPPHLAHYPQQIQSLSTGQIAGSKASRSATGFQRDHTGFSATFTSQRTETVFFSVPSDPGWQAFLNDAPIPIRSDLGFMAVDVPAGESAIRFRYTIPGLKAGIVLSIIGAAGILILLAGDWRRRRRDSSQQS